LPPLPFLTLSAKFNTASRLFTRPTTPVPIFPAFIINFSTILFLSKIISPSPIGIKPQNNIKVKIVKISLQ